MPSGEPEYTIAAVWNPSANDGRGGVFYFVLRGFNFGLKSAPLHLGTVLNPLIDVARKILLVPCGRFYDDVLTVDLRRHRNSAQLCLNFFFSLVGFPFSPKKHESCKRSNAFLGVMNDFSYLHLGYVLVRIKEKRRRKLRAELSAVLKSGKLTPAHAARLRGKLYFTTCSSFFGIGRPALHAFTERQYNKSGSSKLTKELRQAIEFFVELLGSVPPHRFYVKEDGKPPLYVWTDAMFEQLRDDSGECVAVVDEETGELFYLGDAEIAFTAYDPIDCTLHTGSRRIGIDVIRQLVPGKKTYIGQLEAMAADAFLHSMPADRLQDRRAFMWIDNLSAKYSLQKGYSKASDTGRIVSSFKVKQAKLRLRIWFEYVPSEQNIADLPSRRKWQELYDVFDAVFDHSWICFRYKVVVPSYGSWLSPLRGFGSQKRRRHGSRGAKRAGRARVV